MANIAGVLVMICALTGFGAAQTAIEYSLGVSRAGTGAGIGKSAGGVFQKLGSTLEKTTAQERTQGQVVTVTARPEPNSASPKKPKPVFEDPKGIEQGIAAAELTRRFGDPVFKTDAPDGGSECVYTNAESEFTVLVKDSKVSSVRRAPKPQQAGVVILQ